MCRIICFLFLTSFAVKPFAQTAAINPEASLDSMMAYAAANDCFNGVLLVAEKGKVLYNKGFGYSNLATKTANTPSTLFNLCSVTKQFTAMCVMQLKEQGRLGYDDSLRHYFPQLPYSGVTIRQMLHHTSGLPDYMQLIYEHWTENRVATNSDALELLAAYKPTVRFQPGERFEYCNTGYVLLSMIVEKVSGISFRKYLETHIFKPLGMRRTRLHLNGIEPKPDGMAEPYAFQPGTCSFVETKNFPPYKRQVSTLEGTCGDGGIFSCTDDLFKWDRALRSDKLVRRETMEEAFENGILANGAPIAPVGYGFGWFLANDPKNGRIAQHTGGWTGFRQAFIRYLDKDRTIIVLRNNEIGFSSIQRAVEAIIDGKKWDMPKTSLAYLLARAARNESANLLDTFSAIKGTANAVETEINDLGYQLMQSGKPGQALQVMQINVELFPESSNAYDSLGELYLKNGDREKSELSYQKSKDLAQRPGTNH